MFGRLIRNYNDGREHVPASSRHLTFLVARRQFDLRGYVADPRLLFLRDVFNPVTRHLLGNFNAVTGRHRSIISLDFFRLAWSVFGRHFTARLIRRFVGLKLRPHAFANHRGGYVTLHRFCLFLLFVTGCNFRVTT